MNSTTLPMDTDSIKQWRFVGGTWQKDAEGTIIPTLEYLDENLAFYTKEVYADFEAEFDFCWENSICGAGFVFRARDARHYYLVHFPCTGQQFRSEHFWAAISKVGESGWVQVLKMAMVPGVPSEVGWWHTAKIAVKGSEIRLAVDGRPFPTVHDDTYTQPGYVGLSSYSGTGTSYPFTPTPTQQVISTECGRGCFRALSIRGQSTPSRQWDASCQPQRFWFYPSTDTSLGDCQHVAGIARAANGDMLITLWITREFHGGEGTLAMIRSADNGRTWSSPRKLPERLAGCTLRDMSDGRLLMLKGLTEKPYSVMISRCEDNGLSWSEFETTDEVNVPEDIDQIHRMSLMRLRDGTLLWLLGCHLAKEDADYSWASYSTRSVDGGLSWSCPVALDGPNPRPQFPMVTKRTGSEPSAAETRDGKVVVFVRNSEPTMWECWSDDGGKTWRPAARGPFAMYAATGSMLTTASGVLLIGGRHPGLAVQASYDDGITWQCWRIDTTFWANGVMYEVEPDVVLYASAGNYADPLLRAHLIRVTPQGLEPVPVTSTER